MEKGLHKIAEKICWNFGDNFGYAFQGAPLTMFVYDFDKVSYHEQEVLKIRLWQDTFQIFKRQPTGNYRRLNYTSDAEQLYCFIKKACNV